MGRNAEVVLTERFEAHQHTLQQNIESMFDRVRQESTQVADNTMLRVAELRESHNADIARHKELLDRVRIELSQHGLAVNSATSGLEALEKRISEVRDEHCLEVEDLGAALYAIQAHLSHTPVLVLRELQFEVRKLLRCTWARGTTLHLTQESGRVDVTSQSRWAYDIGEGLAPSPAPLRLESFLTGGM